MATSSSETEIGLGQKRKSTSTLLLSGLGQKRSRGTGTCDKCSRQYTNRSKPKFCQCGAHLGGMFVAKPKKTEPEPELVEIVNISSVGTFMSAKVSVAGDRAFCFISTDNLSVCHSKNCLKLRSSYVSSNKVEEFTCEHLRKMPARQPVKVFHKFDEIDINMINFSLDIKNKIKELQTSMEVYPSVVQISSKAYAVKTMENKTSCPMKYVHVMIKNNKKTNKNMVKCTQRSCNKKITKTKQVQGRKFCIHKHMVLLARKLSGFSEEELPTNSGELTPGIDESIQSNNSTLQTEDINNSISTQASALKKNVNLRYVDIPYKIPCGVLNAPYNLILNDKIFEPCETSCKHCDSNLTEAKFPQGSKNKSGNGWLVTNVHLFVKVNIKIKRCTNSNCKAIQICNPYDKGLFNVCNKIIISLDILNEWRSEFKRGFPLSTIIESKMESLLSRLDTSAHPTYGELQYIVELLYNGYYGFEALTKRDLNDVICGLCGIAGKIYYGDGNEKNSCTMMNINIKESSKNAPTQETQVQDIEEDAVSENDESKLDLCLDRIENQLIERCIYASKRNETLTMNIEDVPLLIPSLQRKHELNTEMKKKSCYLKDTDKIEGDAMILSKIINEGRFSMENIDKIDDGSLYNICRECNIKPQNNSKAFLKLSILKLYESIVTGKSSCHEFVKAPGKTGGFYHFVCPHGTTVCSKFMVLCESVRDAADLWLSLKYPPVLFICDTPCTLTQHLNNREPDLMKQYWGDLNGCFQKPEIDTKPNTEVNVPALVPSEFKTEGEKYDGCKEFEHPVTRTKQRYVCGDRFHARSKPHKSPLCSFHDIELCQQGCGITTSHQESMNNKKNNLRNRSSCSQNIATHIFYNYLMNFYENELVVMQQQQDLKRKSGKSIQRDELMRFVISD